MHNDFLYKLPQQSRGKFFKAGMPPDNIHKLFCVHGGFQFLFLGGVPALAPVLVLLNQDLYKPGFMLCLKAVHFPQIGEYASGQKVGANKVRSTVMGALPLTGSAGFAIFEW